MTRQEEITDAAYAYIKSDAVKAENMQLAFGDFINGAKWADEHPKKGMVSIDRACEWLKLHTFLFESKEEIDLFHQLFRKAMEE